MIEWRWSNNRLVGTAFGLETSIEALEPDPEDGERLRARVFDRAHNEEHARTFSATTTGTWDKAIGWCEGVAEMWSRS